MSAITLVNIRTQAQQRADLENSDFITTSEWNQMITNSYKELYDMLVSAYGNDYYVSTPFAITTDGSNSLYALPVDFYKLLGVDLVQGGYTMTLKPFNFSDRNRYSAPTYQALNGRTNLRYRLNGSNLWLSPLPSGGQTINVWYVPQPSDLVLESDTLNGISGWEEYVIIDAAIKANIKQEQDNSELLMMKAALKERIESMAENRDASNPMTVSDVSQQGVEDFLWSGDY